jgi:hypothetical protein
VDGVHGSLRSAQSEGLARSELKWTESSPAGRSPRKSTE